MPHVNEDYGFTQAIEGNNSAQRVTQETLLNTTENSKNDNYNNNGATHGAIINTTRNNSFLQPSDDANDNTAGNT